MIFAATAASLCLQIQAVPPLVAMSDDDLRRTFANVSTVVCGSGGERFLSNGEYVLGAHIRMRGRHWVHNGELCTDVGISTVPTCRRFAFDSAGRIYLTHEHDERGDIPMDEPFQITLMHANE